MPVALISAETQHALEALSLCVHANTHGFQPTCLTCQASVQQARAAYDLGLAAGRQEQTAEMKDGITYVPVPKTLPHLCVYIYSDGRVVMDGSEMVNIEMTCTREGRSFKTLGVLGPYMVIHEVSVAESDLAALRRPGQAAQEAREK